MAGAPLEPRQFARAIRRHVLEQSKRANVGHIGSSRSVADIIAALFTGPLAGPDQVGAPTFVLAKGHAALALYAALYLHGTLDRDTLEAFASDGSLTGVHPDHRVPGIEFSTGSLGQGLSFGSGVALAGRITDRPRDVYVLMSDAECNEGSVWEAAMFAGHLTGYVAECRVAQVMQYSWGEQMHGQRPTINTRVAVGLADSRHNARAGATRYVHQIPNAPRRIRSQSRVYRAADSRSSA